MFNDLSSAYSLYNSFVFLESISLTIQNQISFLDVWFMLVWASHACLGLGP